MFQPRSIQSNLSFKDKIVSMDFCFDFIYSCDRNN